MKSVIPSIWANSKNKKTVIKEIGEDETGIPTINKKKVVTFRITPPKKNPNFKGYNKWKKNKKKDKQKE